MIKKFEFAKLPSVCSKCWNKVKIRKNDQSGGCTDIFCSCIHTPNVSNNIHNFCFMITYKAVISVKRQFTSTLENILVLTEHVLALTPNGINRWPTWNSVKQKASLFRTSFEANLLSFCEFSCFYSFSLFLFSQNYIPKHRL